MRSHVAGELAETNFVKETSLGHEDQRLATVPCGMENYVLGRLVCSKLLFFKQFKSKKIDAHACVVSVVKEKKNQNHNIRLFKKFICRRKVK